MLTSASGVGSDAVAGTTAFVLGGGGQLGAHQVGMLRALFEREIVPDVVIGTSIGALNGAVVADEPTATAVRQLTDLWTSIDKQRVFGGSVVRRARTIARTGTHVYSNEPLRRLIAEVVSTELIEDLTVRFECVAASIEHASAHYFSSGPLIDAVMASATVPGLLPPYEIGGEHFLDGGLVASIPLDRALALGADVVYVLQVGRIEEPLAAPKLPWEVAMVAFEISRRHRFAEALRSIPANVEVHVLPTGAPKSFNDLSQYRAKRRAAVAELIDLSYRASAAYLDAHPRS